MYQKETWLLLRNSFQILILLSLLLAASCQKKTSNEASLSVLKPNTIYHLRRPNFDKILNGCILISSDYADKENLMDRVFLINKRGRVLKKWSFKFRTKYSYLDPDGNLWLLMSKKHKKGQEDLVVSSWFYKISNSGEVIWERELLGAHHQFSVIDEERILFPMFSDSKVLVGKEPYYSDKIVIFNLKSGIIEEEVELKPLFKIPTPSDIVIKHRANKNIHHVNSVEYYKNDPLFQKRSVLISIRNLSKIALIDLDSKKLLWQSQIPSLYFGHEARFLENGNILYFNNGHLRSEVVQIDPLMQKIVWRFRRSFEFFSQIRSGAQRLQNGNTLILESQKAHLFEVDPLGEVVWSILFNYPQAPEKAWSPVSINMFEHYRPDYFTDKNFCK